MAFVAFLGIASGWVVFMGALYLGLSYVLGNVFVQIALMFVRRCLFGVSCVCVVGKCGL